MHLFDFYQLYRTTNVLFLICFENFLPRLLDLLTFMTSAAPWSHGHFHSNFSFTVKTTRLCILRPLTLIITSTKQHWGLTALVTARDPASGVRTGKDTGTSHDESASGAEIYWCSNSFSPHMFLIHSDLDSSHSDFTVCLMRNVDGRLISAVNLEYDLFDVWVCPVAWWSFLLHAKTQRPR